MPPATAPVPACAIASSGWRWRLSRPTWAAWDHDVATGDFWWSPNLEAIFGRPPGSFSRTFEGFFGYIHPEDQDFVSRAITQTMEQGTDYEIEHRIVRPDGSVKQIHTRGRIFYNQQHEVERMVGLVWELAGLNGDAEQTKPPGSATAASSDSLKSPTQI